MHLLRLHFEVGRTLRARRGSLSALAAVSEKPPYLGESTSEVQDRLQADPSRVPLGERHVAPLGDGSDVPAHEDSKSLQLRSP